MPFTSLSIPPETLPTNCSSQHLTIPSTNTLSSSGITQLPVFISPTSQLIIFPPIPHPYTFNIPTSAPLSSQLQTLDGTEYRNHPENFLNGIKAHTIYQLGPETTNSEQYRF